MIPRTIFGLVAAGILVNPLSTVAQNDAVHVIPVSGVIELGLAPFVARAIREAEAAGARAVILELETPGGRVDAAQQIVKAVSQSTIPVYAYVNAHAWSAGAMIALAADSIFMGPVSSIGAATPVVGDGQKAPEKIVSAMRGEFRALAEARGIDPRLAEAMVDESVAVEGVVEEGKLLTLTGSEAVALGFAAAEVSSLEDLLSTVDLAGVAVVTASINWAEHLVRFLSHPIVAPILLSMGTLGLIIEIKTPSFGVAGAIGLISFAAFFGSHMLVGLAGWEEVILLGAGLIALGIEVFVVPGFGLAGAVSILCIGGAVFLALIGSLPTWPDVVRASGILSTASIMVIASIYLLVRHVPTKGRGIFLMASTGRETGYMAAPPRIDVVGVEGVAITDLHPSGTALISGERIDVVSEGGFISKDARVRVIRSEGYRHVVEAV
ncbi:MAG: nodulation protein NfeD [Gemmatimonadetes bacterium]|nr:nodulation protein NfeD [Gemmatimonadota bacterium]